MLKIRIQNIERCESHLRVFMFSSLHYISICNIINKLYSKLSIYFTRILRENFLNCTIYRFICYINTDKKKEKQMYFYCGIPIQKSMIEWVKLYWFKKIISFFNSELKSQNYANRFKINSMIGCTKSLNMYYNPHTQYCSSDFNLSVNPSSSFYIFHH